MNENVSLKSRKTAAGTIPVAVFCLEQPVLLMVWRAKLVHRFYEGACVLRVNVLVDTMPKVEDVARTSSIALQHRSHLLTNALW